LTGGEFQMKKIKHVLKAVLFLCIVLITACGKDESMLLNEDTAYTFSSYTLEKTEGRLISALTENALYYAVSGQNQYQIRAFNINTQEDEIIYNINNNERGYDLVFMSAASDGRVALLNCIKKQVDLRYELIVLDITGTVLLDCEITEYFNIDSEQEIVPKCMMLGKQGAIYLVLSGSNDNIIVLGETGEELCSFICEDTVYSLLTDATDQTYCICSQTNPEGSSLFLWKLDLAAQALVNSHQTISNDVSGDLLIAGGEGILLISEGNSLYKLYIENEKKEKVLNWTDVNIDFGGIQQISILEGGGIGVLAYHIGLSEQKPYYEVISLIESTDDYDNDLKRQDKMTLTYAAMHLDNEMRSWIVDYNRKHEYCQIEIMEYGQDDYETGLLKFNTDIISGNIPDLIDLSDIDLVTYRSKGILTDLYPLLDADVSMGRQDFVPSILRLYESDGKCYGIAAGFRIETLMGKKAILGETSQWTVENMLMMLENMPEESRLINYLEPVGLLRIVLTLEMAEYVNWEEGTCSFDGDNFLQLLQIMSSIKTSSIAIEEIEQSLSEEELILNRIYISDVEEYKEAVDMFQGEETVCIGYPSLGGGSALISAYLPVGITDQCENKDEAWNFVKSLLEEDFQDKHVRFNFPVRINALERLCEQAMEAQKYNEYGYDNTRKTVLQEDINGLYEVINTSQGGISFDKNIWNIIEEETEYYFNGGKSAEETAAVIQRRAEIYISENY